MSWVADPCLSYPIAHHLLPKIFPQKQINNPLTLFGLKKKQLLSRNTKLFTKLTCAIVSHCLNFWDTVYTCTLVFYKASGSPKTAHGGSTGDRKRSAPRAVQQPSRRPAGPVCRGDSACHRPWCSPGGPRTRKRHRLPREVEKGQVVCR